MKLWTIALAVAVLASGCSIDTSLDDVASLPALPSESVAVAESTSPPATNADPEPSPEIVDEPTPTDTPEPTGPDDTPVVVQGDDWVTTQRDFDGLVAFVEETHQLLFSDPVDIVISDDIGAEFARGFEPFQESDWYLLRGLGLADTEEQRLEANQLRLDRIRGFCCAGTAAGQSVVVELQSSKFATELIIVHELTHALHTQHPEIQPGRFGEPDETPFPAAAAFEGVPQFVTFEFMKLGTAAEQAAVNPDLPIIPDDMLDLIQGAAARHLNWAYDTGPAFVDAIVAARGLAGLSELVSSPPATSEQVLFPEKYLAGEAAVKVDKPVAPNGSLVHATGTIGSAMLSFLLAEANGDQSARDMVEPWAGDSYVVYEIGGEICLRANIVMDQDATAVSFAILLNDALEANDDAQVEATVYTGGLIELQSCG